MEDKPKDPVAEFIDILEQSWMTEETDITEPVNIRALWRDFLVLYGMTKALKAQLDNLQ